MNNDEKSFKEELKKLSLEQKFQLLRYCNRSEMRSFIKKRENLDPLVETQLMVLAPYLLLPSKLRKTLSRNYLDSLIKKNEDVIKGFKAIKDDYLRKYISFDDPKLSRKIYAKALHNESIKKKYATDMTIIKEEMKVIIHLLKEEGLSVADIGNFFFDVFYHFNFEKCRDLEPGTYQKKVYMLIKRMQ